MRAAISVSSKAMLTALGWPCATSRANEGPENAPTGKVRPTSARLLTITSVIRRGLVFDALGGADDDLPFVKVGPEPLKGAAQEFRGHDGDDNLGIGHGRLAAGDGNLGGEGKTGQKKRILAGIDDLLGGFGTMRPERDLVDAVAVQRESDGGSPRSGTKYDDAAHAVFFAPKRDSVPASKRRMFW